MKKKVCPECGEDFDPAIDDFKSVKCWGCNFDSSSETAEELFPSLIAIEILKLLNDCQEGVAVPELPDKLNRDSDDVERALDLLRAEHKISGSDIIRKVS